MSRSEQAGPVYAVPVAGRWLVHAPLHRVSALVNARAVASLRGGRNGSERLVELRAALDGETEPAPRPRQGPLRPQFLGLIPTRACNLRCVYCGFGAAQASCRQMDPRLAVAAVDWMAKEVGRTGGDRLDVHLFGGEPFTAPEVVDVIVHRTRAAAAEQGLRPRLEAATNGVFSEERARFIGDYFDWVVLSFDGPAEIQDRRRPAPGGQGSFEAVERTARVLARSPADLSLRITVAADSLTRLEETASWFARDYQPSTIDLETLQPTPESERAGLRPPDPYEFAIHYCAAARRAEKAGIRVTYSAAAIDTPRATYCPVGNDAVIVSPEGRLSACYLLEEEWQARGLDLNLGWFHDGAMQVEGTAVERVRGWAGPQPRCERCFCRFSCAGGCPVHHSSPGCAQVYDDFCIQTRLVTASTLLAGMNGAAAAEELLSDRTAMEALALQTSDRLADLEVSGA